MSVSFRQSAAMDGILRSKVPSWLMALFETKRRSESENVNVIVCPSSEQFAYVIIPNPRLLKIP